MIHWVLHTNECTNYILYISLKFSTLKHLKCSYMKTILLFALGMKVGNIHRSTNDVSPALWRRDATYKKSLINYVYRCVQQKYVFRQFLWLRKNIHHFHISTSYECVCPLRSFELVDDFSLKLGVNILQL